MLSVYRKEIKFVIPKVDFARLQPQLDALMERDKHGSNGTYTVRSQYFDSLTEGDLRDNLDGLMEKRKIRLRVYSPDDRSVKLEYKCKSGSDGTKHSLLISREEAERMERHDYAFLMEREEELAHRLYARMTQGLYRPKTIIEYRRTAFAYPVSDTRITFDHDIRAAANPYGLLNRELFLAPLMLEDAGVLEVKYNDFLPPMLRRVLARTDTLAQASSKYSKGRMAYL